MPSRGAVSVYDRTDQSEPLTAADKIRADGGTTTQEIDGESPPVNDVEQDECDCTNLSDGFPCADCYIEGRQDIPE